MSQMSTTEKRPGRRRNMYRSAPVCVRLCVRELQHGRDLRSTLIQQQNHFRTAAFIHCGSESNGDTAAMEKRSNTGSNVTASLSTCTADRTYIQCATLQPRRHPPSPPSSCAGQAAVPLVQPQTLSSSPLSLQTAFSPTVLPCVQLLWRLPRLL